MKERKDTTIKISKLLYEKIKKRLEKTDFKSVDEYVEFIVNEVLSKIDSEVLAKQSFTKEDEEAVKERLKGLGYLD